ncbi:MAG: polyprenyl synthetase family protein [Bacteroidales bacterium]|nr:polyprenyl synthetase family protein [Bacteroidales bacterium]
MLSIDILRKEIEQEIGNLGFKRAPLGLYEPIEYSMSLGGKRLRPVMCLAACSLFTDDYAKAMPAALAIEMFHNFTLLHDDVMDNADMRRNEPTVRAKWNDNTAILSGDEMLIEAYKLLSMTDTPAFSLVLSTFSDTATEVCEGQQYDMEFEERDDVRLDEYMEMIRLKTAVLLAGAIKIGALIGGANDADIKSLYDYSIDLGLAFQLQDDLLDTFGDEKTFGKAIGGDIMEGKKTYLLISALQKASAEQRAELEQWLTAKDAPRADKVAAVRSLYESTGAKEATEKKMEELYAKAMNTLKLMEISAEGKRFFADFGDRLLKRKR